jgi:hypothetical protein
MKREWISPDGRAPSPLWVSVHGPKPADWQERMLAYTCHEGARELLVGLERATAPKDRTTYLTGALTTLRRIGFTMERWLDGLDAGAERSTEAPWRRSLADDQGVTQRLAWELLLELIGFCGTDQPPFWSHHAALLRLQRHAAELSDVDAFFDCRPASLEALALDAAREVEECESALGDHLSRSWYAKRRSPAPPEKIAKAGLGGLSSQRGRMRDLLVQATPTERVALGVSYQRLYSRLSRRVHFSLLDPDDAAEPDGARGHGDGDVSMDELQWGVIVVGRLGNLCLARLQMLTGLPGGAVCRLQKEARDHQPFDPHADMLSTIANGQVRVGDFALVRERLAEVGRCEVNALNHARYSITYISERPRPDIEQEWQPATEVHTLWEREKVEGWLEDALPDSPADARAALLDVEPAQRLRAYARAIWDAGLRDEVVALLRESPPASYS